MACSKCGNKRTFVQPMASVASVKDCKYTLEFLQTLLSVAKPPLLNYVKSQINVYAYNCNLFQKQIDELVESMEAGSQP